MARSDEERLHARITASAQADAKLKRTEAVATKQVARFVRATAALYGGLIHGSGPKALVPSCNHKRSPYICL